MSSGTHIKDSVSKVLAAADAARDELIAIHRDIVRIPTVNTGVMPTGNEADVCAYLTRFFEREGIASETHESAPTRANLLARLDGTGGGPSLLFMSHTDVVPVEDPAAWTFPPFEAALDDGKVWGRGSSDAKSLVSTGALALAILKRMHVPMRGSLLFLAAADEEAGGAYGAGWVAENLAHRIKADVAINEGAGTVLRAPNGIAFSVANGEKGRYEVKVTTRGKSGHASSPWRSASALAPMSEVLRRFYAYKPTLDTSHPLFEELARLYNLPESPTPDNVDRLAATLTETDEGAANLLLSSSRMTLTPTMLNAGVKSNSIPASATLTCDVRALPSQDIDYVTSQVEAALHGLDGVEVSVSATAVANASPFDQPFMDACAESVREATGRADARLLPVLTGGFTDSRFFRPLGTKVYGFMPTHVDADTRDTGVHGVDERVEVATLHARLRFMVALAARYLA